MIFLCRLVLIIFVLFLATPAIVFAADNDNDVSCFFNLSEEENDVAFDEIKSITFIYSIPISIDVEGLQKIHFSTLNERKVNSIKPNVFLQPPEFV